MSMGKFAAMALIGTAGAAAMADIDVTIDSIPNGSAEIRNDGVRLFSGDVSTAFWNAQPAGQFATVGVMQFDAAAVAAAVAPGADQVGDVSFSLFQDLASFTSDFATVDFWFGTNDIPLTLADLDGINFSNVLNEFGAQKIVEDYTFVQGTNGDNDIIDIFGQGLAGESAFAADLLAGGTITILATSDSGVASWAGAENIRGFDDPSLTVTLTPAPGSVALLAMGGLVGIRRRRA